MVRAADSAARDSARKFLIEAAIVFVAYYIAGKIGQAPSEIRSNNIGPVWPAYGVALASVLRYGFRIWPALAAAAFAVAVQGPVPHIAAAGQAIGSVLAATTGGVLLKWASFDRTISRLRDALTLIVFGALASAMISATSGAAVLYATNVQAYSGIGHGWLIYWLGDSTGVLLITPLALTGFDLVKFRQPAQIAEFAALVFLLVIACLAIFGNLAPFSVRLHVLAFAVLPFIIWAAVQFGVAGVGVSTLVVATIATVATALGVGPFARNTVFLNAVLLDIFFAVLAVSGLCLAAVIAERERTEKERARLIREQAAMEEHLLAADALRESEDNLRLILDSAAEGIFGVDTQWHCTFCNQACVRLLGYDSDRAILGQDMHALIHHSHPDGTPLLLSECQVSDVVRTGQGVRFEDCLWRADGTNFPAEIWSYPQRKGGEIVGAVVGFSDIRQRKEAEDKAAALSEELAHFNRVGMLSALTGALAHEINQPLTAVGVNVETALILLSAEQLDFAELRNTLRDIRNDNQRAGDVLQNVRTLLRKTPTRYEPVEVNSTVGDVVKLIQNSAVRRGILIDVDLTSGMRPVRGDRTQIQQVVLNLLMNACDAVQANERALRRVSLRTAPHGERIAVEVSDKGRGLTDDDIERIFEPFYTTKHDGMGLGLSICRSIVNAHGGTLDATRNTRTGMTFSATFPLWPQDDMAGQQLRQA